MSDHLPEHPKISAVGGEAGWLFVAGLCYCSRNLTDGFIPSTVVALLTDLRRPSALAGRLVEVGLWHGPGHDCPDCPPVEGGFVVHDYLAYQRSAAQVADIKAKRAAAGRRGGQAKARAGQRDGTVPGGGSGSDSGVAGKVPARWQDGDTGPPVAHATPEAEADVSVPSVRETTVLGAKTPTPPVSRRAREPGAERADKLDVDGLVERLHRLRPEWPRGRIRVAVTHREVLAHPAQAVVLAAVLVASDPATRRPGRLRHPGPWWSQAHAETRRHASESPPERAVEPGPRFDAQVNARGLAAARAALDTRLGPAGEVDHRLDSPVNFDD